MYDSETQVKIAQYRQKAIERTLTLEEMQEAVLLLRAGRAAATAAASGSKSRAKSKAPVNVDDLFAELDKP